MSQRFEFQVVAVSRNGTPIEASTDVWNPSLLAVYLPPEDQWLTGKMCLFLEGCDPIEMDVANIRSVSTPQDCTGFTEMEAFVVTVDWCDAEISVLRILAIGIRQHVSVLSRVRQLLPRNQHVA
jgi:hypothetical protein